MKKFRKAVNKAVNDVDQACRKLDKQLGNKKKEEVEANSNEQVPVEIVENVIVIEPAVKKEETEEGKIVKLKNHISSLLNEVKDSQLIEGLLTLQYKNSEQLLGLVKSQNKTLLNKSIDEYITTEQFLFQADEPLNTEVTIMGGELGDN